MTTITEQSDDHPGQRIPPADFKLKYGSVVLVEADLIHICQELVDGIDDDYLRAMHHNIGSVEEFVCALNHALAYHTNAIIAAMRVHAAKRERDGMTVQ